MMPRIGSATLAASLALVVMAAGCGGGGSPHDGAADRADARETGGGDVGTDRAEAAGDVGLAEAPEAGDALDEAGTVGAGDGPGPDGADAPLPGDALEIEARPSEAGADAPASDAAPDSDGPPGPSIRWVSLGAPSAGNVSALAIAPNGTLFAGVGPDVAFQYGVGSGIFTSSDKGASWQPRNEGLRNFNVQDFALTQGSLFTATKDVVRSMDGGRTWGDPLVSSEGFMLVSGAAAGDLVFANDQYPGGGLRRSENGGLSWSPVNNVGATFTTNAVAVLGSAVLAFGDNGLARSTDAGKTFQSVPGQKGTAFPNMSLPNLLCNSGRCYLAGLSTNGGYDFLVSTDDGATWNPIGKPSSFPLALAKEGTLYVQDGTNLLRSDDDGKNWSALPALPMSPTALAAAGSEVYAGTRRGVLRSLDKGLTWEAANGSVATGALTTEAGLLFVDSSSTASNPNGDIYVGAPDVGLLRSVDDGASWSLVKVGFVPTSCVVTEAAGITCIGSGGYLRSMDHGVTWQPWSVPDFTDRFGSSLYAVASRGKTVYVSGKAQLAVKGQVARSDDGGLTFQVLVASPEVQTLQVLGNGHVFGNRSASIETFRSVDDGANWTKVATALSLPVPEDAGHVLYRLYGELQSSTDDGDTWAYVDTHQTLDTYQKRPGAIWFDGAGKMYLSTEGQASFPWRVGPWDLFTSDDLGKHWSAFPARLPHPAVSMAALDKKLRVLVATNGGVYRLDR